MSLEISKASQGPHSQEKLTTSVTELYKKSFCLPVFVPDNHLLAKTW